ncbi:OTU domain-containing protein 4 [Electrophorus electricus]|uniref:OTU domain-containing protein 4 n=1 Tax=Electrophorus electricus TaxID=8005 RepID=UPI0015D03DDF|nr:OTU domain-containing protein 4 [Electrophorus electricus]
MEAHEGNMQANDDKGLEKLMDEYLRTCGFFRRKIAKDGSCLFRAVAEQVLHCQGLHMKVRAECVKYLRQERNLYESFVEGDFEEYLQRLQDPQSWVGQVEITALSVLYNRDFIIYQQPGEPPVNITENGYPDKVRLCFLNGNHYDSVYPLSYTTNAAFCQSILYELLYEKVFHVDQSVLAANMRSSKVRDAAEVEESRSSDESDLDDGDNFWSSEVTGRINNVNRRAPYKGRGRGHARGGGRGYLPTKVQHSLNPTYFRNVEYDVWLRSKKAQQRRDFCMAAGMHYTAGDKCQARVRNDSRYYSAYIQDVSPDDGPVTVFIEELGEKHIIPLWNLRTPSEESWCTVTDKAKRHTVSNGNAPTNEWETKGGRKPVRSVSIPHTPLATAGSAPGNRVQKQNSWPPQATAEARPLGRNASGRKVDQGIAVLSHMEEEHALLDLLQKDENNFPTLEASAQAACSEGGKRVEKKGSRKKADAEMKEASPRSSQKADRGNHGKKSCVEQDQRICPPLGDKPSPSPPSAASPAPSTPKANKPTPAIPAAAAARSRSTPVPSTAAPASIQTTPTQAQTSPLVAKTTTTTPVRSQIAPATPVTSAPTTVSLNTSTRRVNPVSTPPASVTPNSSETASLPSAPSAPAVRPTAPETAPVSDLSPSLSAPVTTTTTSVSTAAVPHPVSAPAPPTAPVPAHVTAQGPETNLVGSQGAPGPGPVMVPPTDPPHEPLAVPVFEVPAGMPTHAPDLPTASGTPPTTVSAPTLSPHTTPPTVPSHSITSTDPANLPSAPAVAPFHPVGLGAFPGMQPPFPPYPPPVHPPTSGAMPTPPPAMSSGQTPPFSHPPEPRLYEAAAPSLVTGVGPVAVPEFQAHSAASPLRHAFSLLSQDPLYPGFPQSDKDDAVLPPPFSLHRTGKDLPKDMNVLRWFFNLGVKAYTNQLWPPVTYLTPLTQAYHMQPNALPSWHPDQNPASLTHVSPAPNHNLMGPPVGAGGGPVNHFEVRGMTPGPPPVEVGGYSRHPHSVPMPMTPRPAVPWSAAHPPHVFQGVYSLPPPGSVPYSEAYAPTSVGHQRLPIPPPLHRRIDIAVATGPLVTERGEGDGQRSMTPQTEKHTWSGRSHLHPGGGDVKPAAVPVALPPAELQHDAGACAIAQAVLIGGATGEAAELTKLANGNAKEDEVTKSFQGGASGEMVSTLTLPCSATDNWEAEEAEYGDPDLRSGRLYYSQSYKSGGRRGHEDRGGFRGGGFRGRSRQHNQSVYHRAYRGRWRGRGYVQYSNTREAGYRGGQFAPSPET